MSTVMLGNYLPGKVQYPSNFALDCAVAVLPAARIMLEFIKYHD